MRRNSGNPPGQLTALLHRFGRLSVVLTTVMATSAASAHSIAASRPLARHGHGGSARAASKPSVHSVSRQHRRTLAHARPDHGGTHYAGGMHKGLVPLGNSTWDNPQIPPAVMEAIQTAARESGVDARLLIAIAWRESRFNPSARSGRSSAKGLLQFTTGTWLQVVRNYGSQHEVGGYAAAIRRDHQSGELVVSGTGTRAAILRMRNDPVLSAKLAAQSMSEQQAALQGRLGRRVTPADLYLLHVLGPTGASRFLTAVAKHPSESSVEVASYSVMRNAGLLARDGRPMSVGNTYTAARVMLDGQPVRSDPPAAVAKAGGGGDAAAAIQVSAAP